MIYVVLLLKQFKFVLRLMGKDSIFLVYVTTVKKAKES
jgi:hypothetical protein